MWPPSQSAVSPVLHFIMTATGLEPHLTTHRVSPAIISFNSNNPFGRSVDVV